MALCYRDQSFCAYAAKGTCINTQCWRYLSDEEAERAKAFGLPIAFMEFPDCDERAMP